MKTGTVGIGQRGTARSFRDAHMHQAAQTAGQPVADLAQGVGAAELGMCDPCRLCSAGWGAETFLPDLVMSPDGLQEGRSTLHRIFRTRDCSQREFTRLKGEKSLNSPNP